MLEILGIAGSEAFDNERLVIAVKENGNLARFAVMNNTFNTDGSLSNQYQHLFSFPSRKVVAGDQVILYTRKDKNIFVPHEGYTNHYFFWNLDESIWNTNNCAVLLEVVDSGNKKIEQQE